MNIAIFASGAGSNAAKILAYFRGHPQIKTALVVSNKPGAGVLSIAGAAGIPVMLIEKERFFRGDAYLPELRAAGITHIVLAGFLWKVPLALIQAFPRHIVNIHPALLPKYGGKGMYGHFVHEAVINNKEPESGISIHLVDEVYDHGELIFQDKVKITDTDTAATLAGKIQALEHRHFPRVIEKWLLGN